MNDSRKYGIPSEPAEREVGFFLVSSFSMLAFIAAIEPLRAANRVSGRSLYGWRLVTVDGAPAIASNGMAQAVDSAIDRAPHLPIVIVCGPYEPSPYKDKKAFAWLRSLARNGAV